MTSNNKAKHIIIDVIVLIVLIAVDQLTKYIAVINLKDKPAIKIIDDVFELNYLENRGAAFGMLQNQKILFLIIAFIMLFLIFFILFKIPNTKHYFVIEATLLCIAAGAVGNMIDRIINTYVVDFFYFVLINFPIFNVADIYVSVACVVLVISVLFFYKDSDFDFLRKKSGESNGTV